MTTLIALNGVLYGDMLHIHMLPVNRIVIAPKIQISANKKFAYGTTGDTFHGEKKQQIEDVIDYFFKESVLEGKSTFDPVVSISFSKDARFSILHKINCGGFLAMDSTGNTLTWSKNDYRSRVFFGPPQIPSSVGSGSFIIPGLLATGMSIPDVYEHCRSFDVLTGSKFIQNIESRQLEPIVPEKTS